MVAFTTKVTKILLITFLWQFIDRARNLFILLCLFCRCLGEFRTSSLSHWLSSRKRVTQSESEIFDEKITFCLCLCLRKESFISKEAFPELFQCYYHFYYHFYPCLYDCLCSISGFVNRIRFRRKSTWSNFSITFWGITWFNQ